MTIVATFSLEKTLDETASSSGVVDNSDVVGLQTGGFATVADNGSSAVVHIQETASPSSPTVDEGLATTNNTVAQLTDGRIIFVGENSSGDGGLYYDVEKFVPGGESGSGSALDANPYLSNADVAALTNGGFAVVADDYRTATDDHVVVAEVYSPTVHQVAYLTVSAGVGDAIDPAVAGLSGGGFAVTWAEGSTLKVAVFDAYGDVVENASTAASTVGAGEHPTITALADGGFAVAFGSTALGSRLETLTEFFDATGAFTSSFSSGYQTDSDNAFDAPSITQLSNGRVIETYTTNIMDGRDTDIQAQLISPGFPADPATGPFDIDNSIDFTSQSSVSAFGLAQFAITYTDTPDPRAGASSIIERQYQLVRTATGDPTADSFTGDDAVDRVSGLGGDDHLSGGANNDVLNGGDGNDVLDGGSGNDMLNSGAGVDVLIGGTGNDTFYVANASDRTFEASGEGTDTVFASISYTLQAGQSIDDLATTSRAGTGAIHLAGNELDQRIDGNAGANVLKGGGSDSHGDTLYGFDGNDTFYVSNAADLVFEATGGGSDTVFSSVTYALQAGQSVDVLATAVQAGTTSITLAGNSLDQTIRGNNGVNGLYGEDGNDTLYGFDGNDKLGGGNGRDVMDGGAGNDVFVYSAVIQSTGENRDLIQNMNFAQDKFDFPAVPASLHATVTSGTLNEASFDHDLQIAIGAAQLGLHQAVLFDPSAGTDNITGHVFLVVDVNGVAGYQAGADYVIELQNATGTLTLADFT